MSEQFNRTLLFSGADSACTLSEPVTNFEYFVIDSNSRQYAVPSFPNLTGAKVAQVGYWQNDGYMEKQEQYSITNGTNMLAKNFQYLYQTSSSQPKLLGSAINRANNIKFLNRIYGVNRVSGTETSAEGVKPSGEGWKTYNEELIGSAAFGSSSINLTKPARAFERVRVQVGNPNGGESPNMFEYNAPRAGGENFTTHAFWGNGAAVNYISVKRWQWMDDTSVLSAFNGGRAKSWNLGFASANPWTTTGSTGNENWQARDITKIWGINPRPVHSLTLINGDHGTISANVMTGYEFDEVTLSNTPDEGWYFSGYNVTGATVNGNVITLQDQDASAQAIFIDHIPYKTLVLTSDGHGTISATKLTGNQGDTVTLSNSYNKYYRFKNYTTTGGSINGSTYTFGSADVQTACANFSGNAFTASGTFEQRNTNIWVDTTQSTTTKTANIPQMYAITSYHTSNVPTAWYSTSKRWKPTDVSNYLITLKPILKFSAYTGAYAGNFTAGVIGKTFIGSTQLHTQTVNLVKKTGTAAYAPTVTASAYNNNYSLSGRLCATGAGGQYYTVVHATQQSAYTTGTQNGTWTATGYAP